ncbi:metallophosphoesterase [Mycetocola reblochoni]|uniref:3',5'-cyclic-nucleotide phosphodiesterase n=2 Tax=Mycetocola reblochoni TaxID=331618 RepID=A0A1R4K8S2_9MICO|nr:metallophosphoesterase [Mycetocola reblochoni]RLP68091.1 phosphodiesterase [Mycetocola reblochoni]SJN40686.1 3',5'-cyclic-nucleotide phosphodiesterase [Mycetocola reblochoni REB411]
MSAVQLGQYPAPGQTIVHLSDPHLLAGGARLGGSIDCAAQLPTTLAQVERSGLDVSALVFTGDLADLGEEEAYLALRAAVEPVADRLGATVHWVMGNHDERAPFRRHLLDDAGGDAPVDSVALSGGLRLITLDSTVPGYHHGAVDDAQLEWLAGVLAEPAPEGSVLMMHHPPIPSPQPLFQLLELERQDRLARVLAGSDVRVILAGHLHYASHASFAGIPVSVAAASCYTMNLAVPPERMNGMDGGRSYTLVHVYADTTVHQVVPVGDFATWDTFDEAFIRRMEALDPSARREAFSRKRPPASR